MRGAQVVLGTWKGRDGAALVVDGQLDDLLIDPPDDRPEPGTVFRAVCDRPVKGQGGMFVRLPDGMTGFLRGTTGLAAGQALTVQVTGHAEAGKAVPVTDRVLLKSRYAIVTPGAPGLNVARSIRDEALRDALLAAADAALPKDRGTTGAILRSAAADADGDVVADDLRAMWEAAARIMAEEGRAPERLLDGPGARERAWRDWSDVEDVAEGWEAHGIPDLIDDARGPALRLGAVTAHVEPTRALVAVDVDTAEAGAGAGLRANLAVAKALMRALRVRGLGGQVVIDAAPMPKRDRRSVEASLKAAARACTVETSFVGWTPLGHAELTRKRERRPLEELL